MAKILIVDDDGDLRTLPGLCFLRRGHNIVVASNGAEGLNCVAAYAPDLLVTDLNMPMMDGLDLLRRLRANGHHGLPVIVLTARSDQRAEAIAPGADAFLAKPVPLRELAEVAEALIEEGRALHTAMRSLLESVVTTSLPVPAIRCSLVARSLQIDTKASKTLSPKIRA